MYYQLTDRFVVAAEMGRVWEFFASAKNLPAITPRWLKFELRGNGESGLELDSVLDYTIRWMGVPVKWRTRIIDWSPPRQFIDLQVKGPYALWHHQHRFTPMPQGVECAERVIYSLPGWLVGRAIHATAVRRQLLQIFRFRRKVIGQALGWVADRQGDVVIETL